MENETRSPWEKIRSMTDEQLRKLFARFVNLSDEQIGQIIDQVLAPKAKACPFCGAKAVLEKQVRKSDFKVVFRYCCSDSTCPGNNNLFFETQEIAFQRWNHRVFLE